MRDVIVPNTNNIPEMMLQLKASFTDAGVSYANGILTIHDAGSFTEDAIQAAVESFIDTETPEETDARVKLEAVDRDRARMIKVFQSLDTQQRANFKTWIEALLAE